MGLIGVFGIISHHVNIWKDSFPATWQILCWHLLAAFGTTAISNAGLKPVCLKPTQLGLCK